MQPVKANPVPSWNPVRELEEMSNRINQIFGRGNGEGKEKGTAPAAWSPPVDIVENEKEFLLKAELPDVKREDMKLTIDEGVLTLRAERKLEREDKGQKYHRIERSYGSFSHAFMLPAEIDAAAVTADYKDGLLTVHLPRSGKPKAKPAEIKVN